MAIPLTANVIRRMVIGIALLSTCVSASRRRVRRRSGTMEDEEGPLKIAKMVQEQFQSAKLAFAQEIERLQNGSVSGSSDDDRGGHYTRTWLPADKDREATKQLKQKLKDLSKKYNAKCDRLGAKIYELDEATDDFDEGDDVFDAMRDRIKENLEKFKERHPEMETEYESRKQRWVSNLSKLALGRNLLDFQLRPCFFNGGEATKEQEKIAKRAKEELDKMFQLAKLELNLLDQEDDDDEDADGDADAMSLSHNTSPRSAMDTDSDDEDESDWVEVVCEATDSNVTRRIPRSEWNNYTPAERFEILYPKQFERRQQLAVNGESVSTDSSGVSTEVAKADTVYTCEDPEERFKRMFPEEYKERQERIARGDSGSSSRRRLVERSSPGPRNLIMSRRRRLAQVKQRQDRVARLQELYA